MTQKEASGVYHLTNHSYQTPALSHTAELRAHCGLYVPSSETCQDLAYAQVGRLTPEHAAFSQN